MAAGAVCAGRLGCLQPKFRQTVQSRDGFRPSGTKAALATFGFHLEAQPEHEVLLALVSVQQGRALRESLLPLLPEEGITNKCLSQHFPKG